MGTRSTTKIYDNGQFLVCIYQQYDGYPDDWGKDLKNFIKSKRWVQGIGDSYEIFNGIRCFTAQLIAYFKDGQAGGLYISTKDDTQEYNYQIDYQSSEKGKITDKIKVSIDAHDEKVGEDYNEIIDTKLRRGY